MRIRALITLAAVLCASCSVKEVRHGCPCSLEVDYSRFAEVAGGVHLELGGLDMDRTVSDGEEMVAVLDLPRADRISVRVWSGVQSDSIFLFGASVPGMEETVKVTAVPHKQFASVLLRILSREDDSVSYTVKSNYSRVDLTTGRALPGDLVIPLTGIGENHVFRLPRQSRDCMLVLETGFSNGIVQAYPLGEWIKLAGYDWEAEDLDDIMVGADFAMGHYEVKIGDWDAGELTIPIL